MSTLNLGRARFESELQVRPDDIDMNQHVHSSRYLDYVLAARFDQMARCYQMGWEEFTKLGYGWVVRTAQVEYKRPLGLGECFVVRTWVQDIFKDSVRVDFEILKKASRKLSCDGHFIYTLVSLETGRATPIPDSITARYSV